MSGESEPISAAVLERYFLESGEKDRLKEVLTQRLRESGWIDNVESMCRKAIQEKGIEDVTLNELIESVKEDAKKAVPKTIEDEVMEKIRSFLQEKFNKSTDDSKTQTKAVSKASKTS